MLLLEFSGCLPEVGFKYPGKVALIRKTAGESNLRQGLLLA